MYFLLGCGDCVGCVWLVWFLLYCYCNCVRGVFMSFYYVLVWLIYKCLLGYICIYWVFMVGVVIVMVVEVLVGYYFIKLMELLVNEGFVDL